MNNLISPYDLGTLQLVELSEKLSVDELTRLANKEFKKLFLTANTDVLGVQIKLTTSKTKFDGERFWFICPRCSRRVGVIYRHIVNSLIGCRKCLNLKYRKQRFKGMLEMNV
ncbi:hypothetical protein M1615_03145 [Patescibacteria group bacterium]|nr:hypothetical protein [Patescibacteria group bacterium]